jgi:aerobic-type carbon monoxide dehydrogenase small subunit (CoxS/CutS family)
VQTFRYNYIIIPRGERIESRAVTTDGTVAEPPPHATAYGVVVEGHVVRGYLMLAIEAVAMTIKAIEGTTQSVRVVQRTFYSCAAQQCGFWTSAMILQAAE